jgi:ankyrin repeat protein
MELNSKNPKTSLRWVRRAMVELRRLIYKIFPVAIVLLVACNESNSMSPLDSKKYFPLPEVATFVDDVQRGDIGRVKKGLASGIDANAQGIKGFRPIHFVFVPKDAEVLKVLLAAGADPMARIENGNTPLHFGVRMPNPEFTRVLLAAGADPNARGANNKPILEEALSSDEPEILRLLARAGADINSSWGGTSPLMSAIITSSWNMAVALLDLNADVAYRDKSGASAVDEFCAKVRKLTPTVTNTKGIPALHAAFKRRGVAVPCELEMQKFR